MRARVDALRLDARRGRARVGWGILWAPVTGLLISELIGDGKVSAIPSLDPFTPGRFMRRAPKRGRAKNEERVGEQW